MKRLRHPVRAIREPFGTAGLIVACIAMVLALTGAAFAAKGALTGKQKKEVEKIAKKFAGKTGASGAAGGNGKDGARGEKGAPGAPAAPGNSVTVSAVSNCPEGGVTVGVEGSTTTHEVCNGEEGEEGEEGERGAPGPTGSPWTAGGTLPPGATETGSWAFNGTSEDASGIRAPISFPIPYAVNNIAASHVHFGEANSGGAFEVGGPCPSPGATNPQAAPGELCIYQNTVEGLVNATYEGTFRYTGLTPGASKAGAMMKFTPSGVAFGAGSFALTAPNPTVTAVSPNHGPAAGGTVVTITGTNLTGATAVKFGTTSVTCTGEVETCKVESPTEIKATAPAQAAGAVDVTVTVGGYTSPTSAADQYTYE